MLIGNVIRDNTAYYESQGYQMMPWDSFDYSKLDKIRCIKKAGRGSHELYNDVVIMADTETSKKRDNAIYYKRGKKIMEVYDNHVVAFTVSLRAYGCNIVTLFGHKPSELIECLEKIHQSMHGERTIVYFHNLSYDYTFERKFMFKKWGFPVSSLNVKSHEPIFIRFANGIEFRDSLILFQRSLDKVGKDFNVEHQKASGKWDYDIIRHQDTEFSPEELEYIEHDTLCGVEALDAMRLKLNKHIYSMPYTATGIPREQTQVRGRKHQTKALFNKICPTYEQYQKLIKLFHGGYTHANRHYIGAILRGLIKCFDFKSSYPYALLSEKYPMQAFMPHDNCKLDYILRNSEQYAWMFKLMLLNPKLKSDDIPMPVLQSSKCVQTVNKVEDNGRILMASYVEIYVNEIDAEVIRDQYTWDGEICVEVECAKKGYLPRWFTDYVFELFEQKEALEGVDEILRVLKKGELNSCYGMCVQRYIRDTIEEDYETGDYTPKEMSPEDERKEYAKHIKKPTTILPYQWGVWCTSYAMRNLFILGKMASDNYQRIWAYSDTDSGYFDNPDEEAIAKYNEMVKQKLRDNGYGPIIKNNKEVWLGIAEHKPKKDEYTEFVAVGAKRYCGRCVLDVELHITVAGVPKSGVKCLENRIENFKKGLIFTGSVTNKKTHTYKYVDEIYIDEYGNETGDSIDLSQCDYILDDIDVYDWDSLLEQQEWYPVRELKEDMFDV